MMEFVARLAATVLAILFVWAAMTKLLWWDAWADALRAYRLPRAVAVSARPAVPAIEIAVALTLAFGPLHVGASASLALLALFSAAIVRSQARAQGGLPCGCFGRSKERDPRLLLARNGGLALLASVAWVGARLDGLESGLPLSNPGALVPFLLSAAGATLAAWMIRQFRANLRHR